MRFTARFAVLAAVAALAVALVAGIGGASTVRGTVAGVKLSPVGGSGAQGVAYLRQVGQKVTGWVVVWGLTPSSAHAMHIHGPNGTCAKQASNVVVPFADITADANGVAFATISGKSTSQSLKKGYYLNVHEKGSTEGVGPGIACADIKPTT